MAPSGGGQTAVFNTGTAGVITVTLASAAAAPTLSLANVNGQMTLNWPTDHTGWLLQAQTNALSASLGKNWATVSGSDASNQFTLPIDASNGSVFFRLVVHEPTVVEPRHGNGTSVAGRAQPGTVNAQTQRCVPLVAITPHGH